MGWAAGGRRSLGADSTSSGGVGTLSFVRGDRRLWEHRTAELCEKDEYKGAVTQLMALADLGIADLTFRYRTVREDKLAEAMAGRIARHLVLAMFSDLEHAPPAPVQLLHRVGSDTIPLDLAEESDGTRAFFGLLGPIVGALKTGGIVCIDELDSSLHPLLAIQLIRLFSESSRNPRGAQLIFNTHDTNLLSSGLRRDQIWFTEKNNDASTHLYPLSDFKPRRNENLESGYLQGRYGAIPFLNAEAFLHFEAADGKT